MYDELVVPLVRRYFAPLQPKPELIAKILGHSEPDVMRKLGKSFFDMPFEFGIYPAPGEVALRLYAESPKIIKKLRRFLIQKFGHSIFAQTDISLAEAVGNQLMRRRSTLAVAESCTGGLLASEITRVPGSSRYFLGGSVCYHNRLKEPLGISSALLRKYGAVSAITAKQLARGIRRQTGASYGLGITGIAGPGGGSKAKPVGLVYIGLASAKHTEVGRYLIFGSRRQVQWKASQKALERLWYFLHPKDRGRR
jgi:nicotinamide-nucleotide amidase